MRYKIKNPTVFATLVTPETPGSLLQPDANGKIPQIGHYIVTDAMGNRNVYDPKFFAQHFSPSLGDDENLREIKRSLTAIKELETLVDDRNEELLLVEASELADKILKLL